MYETYTFDSRSRPLTVKTYNSSDALQDTKSYVWDAASRVTSATEGGVATTYGYDLIDQLTSESRTGYTCSYTDDGADKLFSVVGKRLHITRPESPMYGAGHTELKSEESRRKFAKKLHIFLATAA